MIPTRRAGSVVAAVPGFVVSVPEAGSPAGPPDPADPDADLTIGFASIVLDIGLVPSNASSRASGPT